MNSLVQLQSLGQSVWLDYIRRDLMSGGELARLIREDGLRGMTSNPAIFEKAFTSSADYADGMTAAARSNRDAGAVYESLAIRDIRDAADLLRPVYDATDGADGFVSLEVSPDLANDTEGTLVEARRLWRTVDRPNLMVKVPGTPAGVPAIQKLIGEGININVTLLFARSAYEAVAEAHLRGLEERAAAGKDIHRVCGVASFFVSRIDTAVDALLEARIKSSSGDTKAALEKLLGKAAIANAKLAYLSYEKMIASERWKALAARGARPQRLLWASTSTKNPGYRDVMYVEELIGRDTVNTLPPATLEAFRDHGVARETLTQGLDEARGVMAALAQHGINLDEVTQKLLDDGVKQFSDAFAKLHKAIGERVQSIPA
jgi:transaldolase/glucose-6-phosphate isomerase